jgi:8-oxo-dGTP diphosphatase
MNPPPPHHKPPAQREGVVVVVSNDGRFLLIRRAAGTIAAGAWCFVGGAIEPGESQAEAVRREFREEVGGDVRPIRKVWECTRDHGRLRLHWWLAELQETTLAPNPLEVSEFRWCSPDEAAVLPGLLDSNREFLAAVPLTALESN